MSNSDRFQPFEQTAIYKSSHFLLKNVQRLTASMNRAYKYTAGIKTLDSAIDLSSCIAEAYLEKDPRQKAELVSQIIKDVHRVLIQLRVVYDLQLVGRQLYMEAINQCVEIIRQGQAWRNALDKTIPSQSQDADLS
jgi:hypothetical protein